MVEGHILKFLSKEKPQTQTSRRIFPQQKIGYSKQSPQWFSRKFSLQSQRGYQYKNDQPQIKYKFNYLSQKNNFCVGNQHQQHTDQVNVEVKGYHNRKKGLLSEYLDKNSWMKQTIPLTGFQRNSQSRKLNNIDRQKSIQAAQLKNSTYIAAKTASNFYSTKRSNSSWNRTKSQLKPSQQNKPYKNSNPQNLIISVGNIIDSNNHQRSLSIPNVIGEKQLIRFERNKLALSKIHKFQKFKIIEDLKSNKLRDIDSQFVKQRMIMTARQWKGRKSSPQKSIQHFDRIIGQSQRSKRIYANDFLNKRTVQKQDFDEMLKQNNFLSQQL